MDPDFERRYTEEVLYLHSLWRLGPPRNPNPKPNHSLAAGISIRNPLNVRKRPREQRARNGKKKKSRPETPQDSGPEWPCLEPAKVQASTSSGWPVIEPSSNKAVQPVSSEERAKLAVLQLQYKEFEACREFFARNAGSGSDEEEDDGDSGDDGDDDELKESEEYKFFNKLFVENSELRSYYEKNSEAGVFCCLVCGGIGKKNSGKRFKSCVGLVQHSIAISKTEKRRAHRAFGQVICKVFGWDIDRLPMIVIKGNPLSRSLPDSGISKNENVASLNDNNSQKNGEFSTNVDKNMNSVDGNEQVFEKKSVEDPHSEAKSSIPSENEKACKENDATIQAENANHSISGMGTSKVEEDLPVMQSISETCKQFFSGSSSKSEDESVDNLKNGLANCEEFKFFLKIFTENEDLRRYYENKYEDGEFCCFVCEGIGNRVSKRYKTCRSLLQHSTSISKTKKIAHRAYSLVICKVLGWDIEKLPAIVLKDEPLGCSLAKSGTLKDEFVRSSLIDSGNLDSNIEK